MGTQSFLSKSRRPLAAAVVLSLTIAGSSYAYAQGPSFSSGWFIGAEGGLVTPYFDRDILGADENSGASNELKILSFDWKPKGAYRGWAGYEWATGFGVSFSQSYLNQSTKFSETEDAGGQLRVDFDPDDDDVDISVNGTLVAKNSLKMNVSDLEFWQRADTGRLKLRYGAGVRFAAFKRKYYAYETGGNEFVRFDHEFKGAGPSVNYEAEVPVYNKFSLYNSGRASLLIGKHKSNYQGENASGDAGRASNYGVVPTLGAQIGLQWRGRLGSTPGELTLRAGVDAQAWFNGGGWDLYKDDMAAPFPQHAGSFGLLGFKVSGQYKFGAGSTGDADAYYADMKAIVTPGWFVGAEGGFVTPYFNRDIFGADESSGASNELKILSFDWKPKGAYRGWAGYEWATGFGVSINHSYLNQSTKASETEDAGGSIQVHFDPDSDDVDLFVDGTLVVKNTLKMNVSDLEFWQRAETGRLKLRYGAGVRFAAFKRSFSAYESGGTEFIQFDHKFSGAGPSVNYEAEVPIYNKFSIYNSGRASLLFGKHKSNYQGDNATNDAGRSTNYAMVPTFDTQVGLQWRGRLGKTPGELTLRAGVDAQAWFNGGGWDLYKDDGGAIFPQQAGSFGLLGYKVSAQYKFGAGPADVNDHSYTDAEMTKAGWIIGAEGAVIMPYFTQDVLGSDVNSGASNENKLLSFDWDADGAYRGWVGYEWASGFGVSMRHSYLNHSTKFSETEDAGGSLEVAFDPDTDDADISVNGTLVAKNSLKMNVSDLEFWQRAEMGRLKFRVGAGVRFATYERKYYAYETGGNEFVRFDHKFSGAGPSVNYEVEMPVYNKFSVYNSGRAAVLFGKHKSNYQGESASNDTGGATTYGMVPTFDGQIGLQWRSELKDGGPELTLRAGVDAQAWVNGGGWNLATDDGGANFPQHAGSFALVGLVAGAQIKF